MKRLAYVFAAATLMGLAPLAHGNQSIDLGGESMEGLKLPPDVQQVGILRPSFYWISEEPDDGKPKDTKILALDGSTIATVSASYYKKLEMEGTGKLLDGRVVNYKARTTNPDGSFTIYWRLCGPDAPYGYGLGDYKLNAFRSVAVDPSLIPLGTKVFMPAAIGAILPDGTVHDGYFDAVDIGDLIQKKKIDIFTGFGDQERVFEKVGMETGKMIPVYVVKASAPAPAPAPKSEE